MKALIADDSSTTRSHLRRAVEKRGLEVSEAGNYDDTIKKFDELKPDIVFLDIIMETNRSGIAALQHIKSQSPTTVAIMVTAVHTQEDIVKECLDNGAEEYVNKPLKEDEILDIIDTTLKKH